MIFDTWLPVDYQITDGHYIKSIRYADSNWQILNVSGNMSVIVMEEDLKQKWVDLSLMESEVFRELNFGGKKLYFLSCADNYTMAPILGCEKPRNKAEAVSFSLSIKKTRTILKDCPLHGGIYIERYSRILPTFIMTEKIDDDVTLGRWLTGGVNISARSTKRILQLLRWANDKDIAEIIDSSGIDSHNFTSAKRDINSKNALFQLPGRLDLESFFNEYVVDVIRNKEKYKALGIGFPSAIILHGPPGCGKTFAVEQLISYLEYPSFHIEASSVASPYIHETSKKVSEVFEKAISNAPSVVVIDEMEAFLSDRETAGGQHKVEEVAEFLRRIPEASRNEVLIIGMTNKIDMIDSAILRRGRFDHIINVDFAKAEEIDTLLNKLLTSVLTDNGIDTLYFANKLTGRPLSDVTFLVQEAARQTIKAGNDKITSSSLQSALEKIIGKEESKSSKIGFL